MKATNIHWQGGSISSQQREELLKQKGVILWFTGLSGSGKSTLSLKVEELLYAQNKLVYILDGDNIRHGLNKNLGFSPEDREENIRRISEVAKLFQEVGIIVATAFISPYQKDRDLARSLVPKDRFLEIYVNTPIEICEERDPKGLYKKARSGELKEFTGISAPYEAPVNPEIIVQTDKFSLEECANQIINELQKRNII